MRAVRLAVALVALALLLGIPLAAGAQPAKQKTSVIGLFHVGQDHVPPSLKGLREGLKTLGYEDGRNVRLDWRNLPDEAAARETAQAFVKNRVDVIVAFESQTVRAAKAATSEIPIVFLHVTDPIAEGFAQSLARPGGNLTGFGEFFGEVAAKRVEIFKALVPALHRLLLLVGPDDPGWRVIVPEVRRASAALNIALVERQVRTQRDIERVFASIGPTDVDGVLLGSSNLYTSFPSLVLGLASARRLPLAFHRKEWVEQGALFSYGPNFHALGQEAARYVDKILKGAKPSELPVEQPVHLELAVNLKTAHAWGLTIPRSLLLRADQVIE